MAIDEQRELAREILKHKREIDIIGIQKQTSDIKVYAAQLQKLLLLQQKQELLSGVLENYSENAKRAQSNFDELLETNRTKRGYIATEEEIEKAQKDLVAVHEEVIIAEIELPGVNQEIEELQGVVECWKADHKDEQTFTFDTKDVKPLQDKIKDTIILNHTLENHTLEEKTFRPLQDKIRGTIILNHTLQEKTLDQEGYKIQVTYTK